MKIFYLGVCFAILGAAIVKANLTEELEKHAEVCTEQSKATAEELEKYFENGMKEEDATGPVKCHIKCMMEQNHFFNDGSFVAEEMLKYLEAKDSMKDHLDEVASVISACNNEKVEHDCEGAYMLMKCFGNTEVGQMAFAA
ncbi:general odorant-binding protein 56h-like [Musca vetustissima]|uniref:general odorant-binding protein 56h-like n=1 Tax=Musca vetustissima TaxID=27455 RepID=UPI002AB73A0F|nr:general odorant-binding protein 56h-like [Musca vetustissima]